jgi:hypothetical protein
MILTMILIAGAISSPLLSSSSTKLAYGVTAAPAGGSAALHPTQTAAGSKDQIALKIQKL